ncbi:50S ribosomal protein L17 [Salibacter halophilus]|uniref:Large ribosomal subunit protein bL17 n=1 Tax=Salibacter halophilus TaxID=1803916 RepID=A0A6N6MBH2_9FLAO|nr:50S ribosomal protein L17 [Salibacter halophilus]KAB1066216.1 50S ribosomal protein L17 [Salibacter halophilus]
MRHKKSFNHLGRKAGHRRAMLANMACSLIEHKRIVTTVAKAKALRGYIEPMITRSKTDSTHSRRIVFKQLQSKDAVSELFRSVAPKVADRPGGYTRIIKTGFRQGDAAEMCLIELVDFNEVYGKEEKSAKTKTRRSRRGGGSKKSTDNKATEKAAAESGSDQKEEKATEAKTESKKAEEKKEEKPKKEAPKSEAKDDKKDDKSSE